MQLDAKFYLGLAVKDAMLHVGALAPEASGRYSCELADVALPGTQRGPLKIAVKSELGVAYCADMLPPWVLFTEQGQLERNAFLARSGRVERDELFPLDPTLLLPSFHPESPSTHSSSSNQTIPVPP